MRASCSSIAVAVIVVAGDGLLRGASSFLALPSSSGRRGGNSCCCWSVHNRGLATRRRLHQGNDCYSYYYCNLRDSDRAKHGDSNEEQGRNCASRGSKHGRESVKRRRRRSTAAAAAAAAAAPTTTRLQASSFPTDSSGAAPTAGVLPSLDGLPGIGTTQVVPQQTASSPHSTSTHGRGGGGRSRRGKYPVIELYRRHTDMADSVSSSTSSSTNTVDSGQGYEDCGSDGVRRRSPRAAADDEEEDIAAASMRRGPATAMQHLSSVLRLGPEQADLMLESFPALADVHPDKLDLPAKLVSYTIQQKILLCTLLHCMPVYYVVRSVRSVRSVRCSHHQAHIQITPPASSPHFYKRISWKKYLERSISVFFIILSCSSASQVLSSAHLLVGPPTPSTPILANRRCTLLARILLSKHGSTPSSHVLPR